MRNSTLITCLFLIIGINSFSRSFELNNEALKLAGYIEASIENGNPSYLNSLFHYKYFSKGLLNYNSDFKEFNQKFEAEIIEYLDPGNLILDQVDKNGAYKFINAYSDDDNLIFIFRVYTETGLDYHEYFLQDIDGEYKIVDIYMYYDDILLSEQVAGLYKIISQNVLPELYTKDNISSTKKLLISEQKLLKSLVNKDYKKTFKQWRNFENSIKESRKVMTYAVRAASYTNFEEMESIYNRINNNYSNTNGINLIVLEGLFEQGKYSLTLKYIDNLDKAVHYDPYLNYLRASVYKTIEKPDKAEWFLNKFIEDLPDDKSGYFSLLELYLENSKYNDATLLLDKLTELFGFYKEEFKPILNDYPNYTNSQEYAQWVEE